MYLLLLDYALKDNIKNITQNAVQKAKTTQLIEQLHNQIYSYKFIKHANYLETIIKLLISQKIDKGKLMRAHVK